MCVSITDCYINIFLVGRIGALNAISGSLDKETRDVMSDEHKIREIDGKIDHIRDGVIEPINRIIEGRFFKMKRTFD